MFRFLAFVFGLLGAVASSQAPEFTRQYLQNLSGRVESLEAVVARFDEDAARSGLSRAQALELCQRDDRPEGGMSCLGRAGDVADFERYRQQLQLVEASDEWTRPVYLARNFDREVFESTRAVFRPAVPTTLVGGGYALAGFALFWGLAAMIFGVIGSLFGRDRY